MFYKIDVSLRQDIFRLENENRNKIKNSLSNRNITIKIRFTN